jgi:hypothetical protein
MAIQPKQIAKLLQAWVGIAGFTAAGGTSDTITSVLTTALGTAGNGGVSVPLQVGSGSQEGVNTSTGFNQTQVFLASNGDRLVDGAGNDVYAKITNSGSVWTLSYFSAPNGTETPYTMVASTVINFEVPYVFTFDHLPYTAIAAMIERHIAPDLATFGYRQTMETLTVTATNTLANAAYAPNGTTALLLVNGVAYTATGAAPPFSYSGKTLTWSAANAGFSLATTDDVKFVYSY